MQPCCVHDAYRHTCSGGASPSQTGLGRGYLRLEAANPNKALRFPEAGRRASGHLGACRLAKLGLIGPWVMKPPQALNCDSRTARAHLGSVPGHGEPVPGPDVVVVVAWRGALVLPYVSCAAGSRSGRALLPRDIPPISRFPKRLLSVDEASPIGNVGRTRVQARAVSDAGRRCARTRPLQRAEESRRHGFSAGRALAATGGWASAESLSAV
jgi:hypothetical protein